MKRIFAPRTLDTKSELLDVATAARLAGVSTRTVRNWQASRAVSFIKLGKVIRFERQRFLDELRAFTHHATA